MDTKKVKACIVSFSDAPKAFANLKRIIPSCVNPSLVLSRVFPGALDPVKVQETTKAIDRLKPGLVFIVFAGVQLNRVVTFVNSLQQVSLKPGMLALLEDPTSGATIDLLKLGGCRRDFTSV